MCDHTGEPTYVVELQVKLLDPGMAMPGYARPGDAGLDLMARHDALLPPVGGRAAVATGIAIALPEGCAGLVLPRSGLARNYGVTLANSPGLIDSGYRGEIVAVMLNTDPDRPYEVRRGDRIAQLVVQEVARVCLVGVDQLPGSRRGHGGFGHSGR